MHLPTRIIQTVEIVMTLCYVLRKTLNRVSEVTLPSHKSDKSLADQFAYNFLNKITKIRDTFATSGTKNDVHRPFDPPIITAFTHVSEYVVDKISATVA